MKIVSKIIFVVCLAFAVSISAAYGQDGKTEKKSGKAEKFKVVTFDVNLHCHGCKEKVEKNIPWEKGVKDLKVDLDNKTVKITYDSGKTNEEKLKKSIEKLDFKCSKPEDQKASDE